MSTIRSSSSRRSGGRASRSGTIWAFPPACVRVRPFGSTALRPSDGTVSPAAAPIAHARIRVAWSVRRAFLLFAPFRVAPFRIALVRGDPIRPAFRCDRSLPRHPLPRYRRSEKPLEFVGKSFFAYPIGWSCHPSSLSYPGFISPFLYPTSWGFREFGDSFSHPRNPSPLGISSISYTLFPALNMISPSGIPL